MIHEARIYWAAGFFLNFDLYLVFERMEPGTCQVDIFFRQITTFIKVHVAFDFGLKTL